MGGGQSARKLQIDNDTDPATVIKVSERVVQRIRSGAEKEIEQEFKDSVKKEVENEIQKNNEYWEKRIANLQKNHEKINQIMEEEYVKAVEEIQKVLPELPPEKGTTPCLDKKGSILKCYKTYNKKPLLCAQEVEAFNCCMRDTRLKVVNEQKA